MKCAAWGVRRTRRTRKERLTAELNGKLLQYSPQLKQQNDPLMQVSLIQEERIFNANRDAESKGAPISSRAGRHILQLITTLDSQLQINAKTVALSTSQMHDLDSLLAKG